MKSPTVSGNVASSAIVNGSIPRSSSSRATRIANASESKPVSCNDNPSSRDGNVICCSSAICFMAAKILSFTDIEYSFSQPNLKHNATSNKTKLQLHSSGCNEN